MPKVLLASIEGVPSESVEALLTESGYQVSSLPSDTTPRVLFSSPGTVVVAFCGADNFAEWARCFPVVAIGEHNNVEEAVGAMRMGAVAYVGLDEIHSKLAAEVAASYPEAPLPPLTGSSELMQQLRDQVDRVANSGAPVVITGEAGSGKDRVARRLHMLSDRSHGPFISYNCAAAVDTVIDRDLFGDGGQRSVLNEALGGTLFLDEITALSERAQARLLATLDNSDNRARLLAGSRRDLDAAVEAGDFRADLLLRLNVVTLVVPALRNRIDDIDELADECLARSQDKLGRSTGGFTDQARADMRRYHWPGNLRELENAVERAVILCDGAAIDTASLAIRPDDAPRGTASSDAPPAGSDGEKGTLEDYFVSFVLEHEEKMTETEIAKSLGISRKSLWERRQRLNIPRKRTRARKSGGKTPTKDG